MVELPYRYDFYKRLADISLFITGIFPEYLQGSEEGNSPFPEKHMGHSERTSMIMRKRGANIMTWHQLMMKQENRAWIMFFPN